MLVAFEGIADRDQAQALAGSYLFVPTSESPSLPEGEYWPHQLVGCEVISEGRRSLGRLAEVIHTPANDVWVIRGDQGEALIPALKDVVSQVDLDGRKIVVREVPGLTAP
jgi:16S rRNA processing protein RimM